MSVAQRIDIICVSLFCEVVGNSQISPLIPRQFPYKVPWLSPVILGGRVGFTDRFRFSELFGSEWTGTNSSGS